MRESDRFGLIDIVAARAYARDGAWPDWYLETLARGSREPSSEVIEEAHAMRANFLAGDPLWRTRPVPFAPLPFSHAS